MSEVHISSHFNTLPRHGYQRLNRHRILTTWDCWHCLRNLLFVVVLTLIGYKFIYWPSPKNCITFPLLRNDESDQVCERVASSKRDLHLEQLRT
ncbi:hypothetical protein RB195_005719 [Necator americanus]|uniref:Uncharacterized protein n=1 Tax=Necator americanus TaxID=51031 RepID=A0ABR1BT47_NECAM